MIKQEVALSQQARPFRPAPRSSPEPQWAFSLEGPQSVVQAKGQQKYSCVYSVGTALKYEKSVKKPKCPSIGY